MVGGRSGIALKVQVMSSSATPCKLAVPPSLITKRRSSVPAGGSAAGMGAGVSPPVVETSRWAVPVARMTSVLPAGTVCAAAVWIGSPARSPGRITGGLPV